MNIFTPDIADGDWYSWGMYVTFMIELSVVAIVIVVGLIRWIVGMFSKRDVDKDDSWSYGLGEDDVFLHMIALVAILAFCVAAWPLALLGVVISITWLFVKLWPRSKA